MALLMRPAGAVEEMRPADGRAAFTLAELHAIVGGDIELVRGPRPGLWLVFSEDGKARGLASNWRATVVYRLSGGARDDWLVGDVLLVTAREVGHHDDDEEHTV